MSGILGIDLGTFNSSAAVALSKDQVLMVQSKYGSTVYGKNFPSFVLFDHIGKKQLIGQQAKNQLPLNPKLVIWGVKRLVGLSYDAALKSGELDRFQYDIEKGPGDSILIKVGQERFTVSHILELILREIKRDAEDSCVNPILGGQFNKAVISVPAYFKAIRTQPIIEAACNAGFTEVKTIAEPTAAAICYGLRINKEAKILAVDIGAGTLDVTLLQIIQKGDTLSAGELCTSGRESFGGIDMDDLLLSYILEESKSSALRDDPRSLAILKDEVEKIKIRLSSRKSATVDLPSGKFFDLTRRKLEKILSPLLEKCRAPIQIALKQARLTAADIDHIVLVGGPTHMPCVRRIIADELEKLGALPKLLAEFDSIENKGFPVNPMECVSQGAALAAGNVMKPTSTVVSEGYGTKFGDFYSPIIKVNSSYPNNGNQKITYGDPNLKHVLVSLIAKTPDVDNSSSSNITYKYESLGDVSISIEPTGDAPNVDLQLEITEDKRLIATVTHTQSSQQICYESLDLLVGNVIGLQEDKKPEPWSKERWDSVKQSFSPNSGWTEEALQSCVHIATQALELAKGSDHPKVTKAVRRLRSIIKQTNGCQSDPKRHGPDLANRTKELFDKLRLPATELITECQYRDYMKSLTDI